MSQDRRGIADEREERTNRVQRFHRSHPVLSFVFLDFGACILVIGAVWLLPFVRVRWSTAVALFGSAIVLWIVLVFDRPPRPGIGRR